MHSNRTVNFMLVINAVLLTTLVLGHLGASPLGPSVAAAAPPPAAPLNSAAQRQQMIAALVEMNKDSTASTAALDAVNKNLQASVELQQDLVRMLERGNATVTVKNLDTSNRHGGNQGNGAVARERGDQDRSMTMKQVKAIVRPTRLDTVLRALHEHLEVPGVSVSHVQGFGQHFGREPSEDGSLLPFGTGAMCKVECIVSDELLDSVVGLIQEAAHTGEHGDGRIFVIPVEAMVTIRTGDRATAVS